MNGRMPNKQHRAPGPALCTGAATARDNRCGMHLQSPVVHVQAVGNFPSEPIWLDAGSVSVASSRSTASTDGGHQHPQQRSCLPSDPGQTWRKILTSALCPEQSEREKR